MTQEARVVLLTGNEYRHMMAARCLADHLNLVGIISEAKAPVVPAPSAFSPLPTLTEEERAVITRHFAERDEAERRLFGVAKGFPETDFLEMGRGAVNDPGCVEWVEKRNPDFVLLYGTSIVRPPLLDLYTDRVVNLHLGLSPYYRGAGTNFWPLVNRQPECLGATIHLAVPKVDAGPILAQVRPEAGPADRAHELGTKALIAALDLLPTALSLWHQRAILTQQQDLALGKVYRLRDFNAEAVRTMWSNFDRNMMGEYLAALEERQARCPIVELAEVVKLR